MRQIHERIPLVGDIFNAAVLINLRYKVHKPKRSPNETSKSVAHLINSQIES